MFEPGMYGGWGEHIRPMFERRHDKNILIVAYEDLKKVSW